MLSTIWMTPSGNATAIDRNHPLTSITTLMAIDRRAAITTASAMMKSAPTYATTYQTYDPPNTATRMTPTRYRALFVIEMTEIKSPRTRTAKAVFAVTWTD